jgi:TctA family transporter
MKGFFRNAHMNNQLERSRTMAKDRGLTRRGFLQGSAVGAGAAVLAGLGASVAGAAPVPKRWNREVDVVVVGFGGAGAAAAVAAKEAGSKH